MKKKIIHSIHCHQKTYDALTAEMKRMKKPEEHNSSNSEKIIQQLEQHIIAHSFNNNNKKSNFPMISKDRV